MNFDLAGQSPGVEPRGLNGVGSAEQQTRYYYRSTLHCGCRAVDLGLQGGIQKTCLLLMRVGGLIRLAVKECGLPVAVKRSERQAFGVSDKSHPTRGHPFAPFRFRRGKLFVHTRIYGNCKLAFPNPNWACPPRNYKLGLAC